MKTNQLLSIGMAGVLSVGAVFAQEADPATACAAMMPGMMGAHKGAMMEWHQKMMEKIKTQDAELDKLVQQMNSAQGDKKVDAIAAILNKLMEDRKMWHAEMQERHKKMMEWMQNEKGSMESPKMTPTPGSTAP
jgi:hypothetical protein